jgi:D-glycero-alpha-D-manno-heptose-7-phosphate kinase
VALYYIGRTDQVILVRSPLRISLGGGGTDLPSYSDEYGGFVIAAAINKYVYVMVHRRHIPQILLKYSQLEEVGSIAEIKHPIIREALKILEWEDLNLEISSIADIPAGTGMGSSGSFTTALLKALSPQADASDLARAACRVEIEKLREPIGKQDQYIAAYGGIRAFSFTQSRQVREYPFMIEQSTLYDLEDSLALFFTGDTRSASEILKTQDKRSAVKDKEMIENLHFVKQLGYKIRDALQEGDVQDFGILMKTHWQWKKERSPKMTTAKIDAMYDIAMNNGAIGGKLVGAGGGGYLLFVCEDRRRVRKAMDEIGVEETRFRFDWEGTKVLVQ